MTNIDDKVLRNPLSKEEQRKGSMDRWIDMKRIVCCFRDGVCEGSSDDIQTEIRGSAQLGSNQPPVSSIECWKWMGFEEEM